MEWQIQLTGLCLSHTADEESSVRLLGEHSRHALSAVMSSSDSAPSTDTTKRPAPSGSLMPPLLMADAASFSDNKATACGSGSVCSACAGAMTCTPTSCSRVASSQPVSSASMQEPTPLSNRAEQLSALAPVGASMRLPFIGPRCMTNPVIAWRVHPGCTLHSQQVMSGSQDSLQDNHLEAGQGAALVCVRARRDL